MNGKKKMKRGSTTQPEKVEATEKTTLVTEPKPKRIRTKKEK